ncbi:ACT domain-containing protein [Clostridium perfringens]|uniref:ACT domain-containing protein n=1 Tax=Clostridium perfringens TaxID=1502 RepID=UPI00224736AB|nr:ACT domain-containing protein [Clostridium perfringens]MCX0395492.1 ACT domain-containing protein [Clostridium perfringens]MCX0400223.1 ACT domain-containing protein [Clostridium perfringens]MDU2433812.1 ACT domain-containing protein [Clostridium perfringens]MDU2515103.1 ACT domain-containing protein [Clostridium perfringens]
MNAVITVVGKDKVGIIHGVSGILNENNVNILNISQTIMDGYFTMIMLTDISNSTKDISYLKEIFREFSFKNSLDISVQHEDIFNSMHRI